MAVRGPADFFPPLGFLSWVGGLTAVVLSWRVRPTRWWMLLSVVMIVADGLVSMLFFWPRNEVMFVEGAAVHSAEVLRQTAREFQTLHWSRLAFNAASAAFAFAGFVAFDRQRLLAQQVPRAARQRSRSVPRDDRAGALA
jgi:signal transduction histidine kinase